MCWLLLDVTFYGTGCFKSQIGHIIWPSNLELLQENMRTTRRIGIHRGNYEEITQNVNEEEYDNESSIMSFMEELGTTESVSESRRNLLTKIEPHQSPPRNPTKMQKLINLESNGKSEKFDGEEKKEES